jgi:hypothetical protein
MTRLLGLINGVQRRSLTYCSSVNHTRRREKEEKKMRRLYDDASTVKRKKGQRKKKVGETDAKLTISNISYQKEKRAY